MSEYVWRMHVMVPVTQASLAAEAAAEALPGGEAERAMFGVPLERTRVHAGQEAMLGCSTLLTEGQRATLMAALANQGVRAVWVCMDAHDGRTSASSDGVVAASGRVWDWGDTLAAADCRTIAEVTDGG